VRPSNSTSTLVVRTNRERAPAALRWIGDRVARPGYRGCPQINIAAEYADENHPARKVAVAHKRELRSRLTKLAKAMKVPKPDRYALQVALLIDGALSSGRALHDEGPARFLQQTALALRAACKTSQARGPSSL
jgi:hypothetical protein